MIDLTEYGFKVVGRAPASERLVLDANNFAKVVAPLFAKACKARFGSLKPRIVPSASVDRPVCLLFLGSDVAEFSIVFRMDFTHQHFEIVGGIRGENVMHGTRSFEKNGEFGLADVPSFILTSCERIFYDMESEIKRTGHLLKREIAIKRQYRKDDREYHKDLRTSLKTIELLQSAKTST